MKPLSSPPASLKLTAAVLLLSAGAGLGACTSDQTHEYLAHTDKVTSGSGDASSANKVTHTINPWPAHSRNTQIDMDGKRAGLAAKRYETNTSIKPKGLSNGPTALDGGQKN
jgi:hypothetical protein